MKPKKKVYGVGINDADYVTQRFETIGYVSGDRKQKLVWKCPYYSRWAGMLKRCYSKHYQSSRPTYAGCIVSEEWRRFSAFKEWMMTQDWEGNHLDKDWLFEGNKVYSAETCVFISPTVNNFNNDNGSIRGEWLTGTYWHKRDGKFIAQCSNPFTKKIEKLGYFDCEKEAHEAWLTRKLELAHKLAENQTDHRVAKALVDRYSKSYTDKALK